MRLKENVKLSIKLMERNALAPKKEIVKIKKRTPLQCKVRL